MARHDLTVRHATETCSCSRRDADSHAAWGIKGPLRPRIGALVDAHAGSVDESFDFGANESFCLLYDYPVSLHGKNSPVVMTTGAPRTRSRSVTHRRALEGS